MIGSHRPGQPPERSRLSVQRPTRGGQYGGVEPGSMLRDERPQPAQQGSEYLCGIGAGAHEFVDGALALAIHAYERVGGFSLTDRERGCGRSVVLRAAVAHEPSRSEMFRTVLKEPTEDTDIMQATFGKVHDHVVPKLPMTMEQVAADLTERIARGEYPPGTQLPTYASLAALYSVSEGTITNVMRRLRDRGVVVGIQGRGTFVPPDPDED